MRDRSQVGPAALKLRAAARAIDIVVSNAAILLFVYLTTRYLGWLEDQPERSMNQIFSPVDAWVLLAYLFVVLPSPFVLSLVYEVLLPVRSGQTFGKRRLGVCIVGIRRGVVERASFGQLLARWLTMMSPVPLAVMLAVWDFPSGTRAASAAAGASWLCAWWLPAALTHSRRGLHDLLAGTAVVPVSELPHGHPAMGPSRGGRLTRWRQRLAHHCRGPGGR